MGRHTKQKRFSSSDPDRTILLLQSNGEDLIYSWPINTSRRLNVSYLGFSRPLSSAPGRRDYSSLLPLERERKEWRTLRLRSLSAQGSSWPTGFSLGSSSWVSILLLSLISGKSISPRILISRLIGYWCPSSRKSKCLQGMRLNP